MITNKPTAEDFEHQSVQYLEQAFSVLIRSDNNTESLEEDTGVSEEDYWRYNQGVLSNSLALLFLSIENHLKAQICRISPLLLLAEDPKKWGGDGNDKEYSELFIHSFESLVVLYRELGLGLISDDSRSSINELRKKRNFITHGVLKDTLTPGMVVETIRKALLAIWGPRIWWDLLREYEKKSPMFGIYDPDVEIAWNTSTIDYLVSILGKKKVGYLLDVNLKSRLYYCPTCTSALHYHGDDNGSKWSTLSPNEPTSEMLYCIVCDATHRVIRKKCLEPECEGNVISDEDVCLTCFTELAEN